MAVPVMKKESDHALALRSLELLFKKYPFSYENLKPVSFGISEILKNFFSSRFTIDAREATPDEMIALLRKEAIPREGLQEILNLFNDLDLIKFTKESDSGHFKEHHYQDFKIKAQSIIQKWALHTGGTSL